MYEGNQEVDRRPRMTQRTRKEIVEQSGSGKPNKQGINTGLLEKVRMRRMQITDGVCSHGNEHSANENNEWGRMLYFFVNNTREFLVWISATAKKEGRRVDRRSGVY